MLYEQQVTGGAPLQLNVPGRFFLLDSTGDESTVTVELLRGGSPIVGRIPGARRGLKIGIDAGFDGVRIEAAGNTTVRFFATFENVSISTTDGADVSIPGGVEITNDVGSPVPVVHTGTVELTASNIGLNSPDTLAPVADVSINAGVAGQVVAASVKAKREVIIKNPAANAASFRIAGATVAAALGFELAPGESITMDTTAAIHAFNTGAGAQSLSVLTIYRN